MNLNRLALNNVLRDKWTYFAYFVSSVFSIFIFFCFSVVSFHPKLSVIESGSTLSLAMLIGDILVYIFSFIFILYSIKAFIKSREKNLGLFIIMGASNKQINNIIFKENMIIGVAAIFTAIIFGLVFSPLFLMIAKKIMLIDGFSMYIPTLAIVTTVVMFLILFLIISIVSLVFIRKNKIINLLKADKTDEKEVRFSPLAMMAGIFIILTIFYVMTFGSNQAYLKVYLDSEVSIMIILFGMLIAGNILYKQISVIVISKLRKTKFYLRKTNMIIISDMKSKLRSNSNIMYLMTILFTSAFFTIVFLYAVSADVEETVKKINPYNITYISFSSINNSEETEHIKLIEDSLKDKEGYKKYTWTLITKEKEYDYAILTESEYNNVVKSTSGDQIKLKDNEIYIVSGLSKVMPSVEINEDIKAIYSKEGIEPNVLGTSEKNITPSGLYAKIIIVNDKMANKFDVNKGYSVAKYYGFNISNWKTESKASEDIITKIKGENLGVYYTFISTEQLYSVEKTGKNLSLFVGFSLSAIFIISASSMIYFKLSTELEKECNKFKGIVKLGLSKKELSNVISTQVFTIMFLPFIISIILVYALGITPIGQGMVKSYFAVSSVCTIIFLVLQILGYIGVSVKYKEAVFNKVI